MKPYIIAETAYNHEGDIEYLMAMVKEIGELPVNAIKFHLMLNIDEYFQANHPLKKILTPWLFNKDEWDKIFQESEKKELDIVALCDDLSSLEYILEKDNISAIEIHATGINDVKLLKTSADFKGDIILGIGGCSIDEIQFAIDLLKENGHTKIILMYGFQSFPTDYAKINISKMILLRDLFKLPIGYCDHTRFNDEYNEIVSILPAANGFNILEKHFTLDEGVDRVDYQAAIGKEKLIKISNLMDLVAKVYGTESLTMSPEEKDYGKVGPMKKAIVAQTKINKGDKIKLENLTYKRTESESYLTQKDIYKLIGQITLVDIEEDEMIDYKKIKPS